MKIKFYKYQGTGNDFIMIDNRTKVFDSNNSQVIAGLCDRKFGVGADGLICLNTSDNLSFEMDYSNADGSKSFCGNGARCTVAFAQNLGIVQDQAEFTAIDGYHYAQIQDDRYSILMKDVQKIEKRSASDFLLDTGSPHYVRFIDEDSTIDIVAFGKEVRYSEEFKVVGVNVNVAKEISPSVLYVETYERGVEDETLSCGTGVTAVALSYAFQNKLQGDQEVSILTKGGKLSVAFHANGTSFSKVFLKGPALCVFEGEITL